MHLKSWIEASEELTTPLEYPQPTEKELKFRENLREGIGGSC